MTRDFHHTDSSRDGDEFLRDGLVRDTADEVYLDRLKADLYHIHLPKLAEHEYIEWDPETETIRPGPNFDELVPLLAAMNDPDDVPDVFTDR